MESSGGRDGNLTGWLLDRLAYGLFPNMGLPQELDVFFMENPFKMDDDWGEVCIFKPGQNSNGNLTDIEIGMERLCFGFTGGTSP